jgi:hypothetical protein
MTVAKYSNAHRTRFQFRLASLFWLTLISSVFVLLGQGLWPLVFLPKWKPSPLFGIKDVLPPRDFNLTKEAIELRQRIESQVQLFEEEIVSEDEKKAETEVDSNGTQ